MLDLNQYGEQLRQTKPAGDPVSGFLQAMGESGINFSGSVISDGAIHRFSTNGKKDKSGWYLLHADKDFAAGAFGDWRTGDSIKWCSVEESKMSTEQRARRREIQEKTDKAIEEQYHKAAGEAKEMWEASTPASNDFPYLAKKRVRSHGLRINKDGVLLVPMRNNMGEVRSLQRIYPDGSKYNFPGGEARGHYFTIDGKPSEIYICEGYATGASIHEATGGTVIVAFSAGNLYPVTRTIKSKYPTSRFTLCADNDQWTTSGNTGIAQARKTGEAFGIKVVWPTFSNIESRPTDFNDLANLEGIDAVRDQIAGPKNLQDPWEGQIYTLKDAYAPREPLKFLVAGLLTEPSLSIVYGAPGTLKSMLLGDMAVCVAAGRSWLQREVIQSPVLWIDFDNGQRRTHERFAALARARSLPDNTPLSYVSMPQPWLNAENPEDIEKLMNRIVKNNIKLVCIDNLGLISMGAEEKSDAMIPIMANLRLLSEQTGAAVSVIHHQRKGTSVNSRAGDSLRGHSGIEGAIDLALLVTREECGNWITIQSTKTRDVEVLPFMAEFRYDHKIGSNELQTASFVKIELEDRTSDAAIEKALIDICNENPVITQKKAVALAKKDLDVGINRIRHVYKQLKNSNRITSYNVVEDD